MTSSEEQAGEPAAGGPAGWWATWRPRSAAERRADQAARWQRVRRWTAGLLLVWALASFALPYGARVLDFDLLGWPFSFWWAAQGAPLLFLLIVVLYAVVMHRLDVSHHLDEED